jgi:UPF0755 protein
MTEFQETTAPTAHTGIVRIIFWILAGIITLLLLVSAYVAFALFVPASKFPTGHVIVVASGSSLGATLDMLAAAHVIRNPLIAKAYARFMGGTLRAGSYEFAHAYSTIGVFYDITHGVSDLAPARVTLPEGLTAHEMALVIHTALPDMDTAVFESLARPHEGYLFPDTYFILPGTTPDAIVSRMTSTFDRKITTINDKITAFKHPVSDVVIMASILEREAKTTQDRRIIAGILWKRLAKGMPLQVDATFGYIHQASGYTPTEADLKLDSPYNTYLHKGLPPTPIANPGLDALTAAVTPIPSSYVYYLTDKNGVMHYSTTYVQHTTAKAKYLK